MSDTPLRKNPFFWISWLICTAGCEYWIWTDRTPSALEFWFWAPFMGFIIMAAVCQSIMQIYICWNLDKFANDIRDWLNYR